MLVWGSMVAPPTEHESAARAHRLRRWTYELLAPGLGGRLGHVTDCFIMGLIAVNVAAVIIGTVDSVQARFGSWLQAFEVFSVVVFTLEYAGRIWSVVEHDPYAPPITGRLRFASKPLLVVDLLAIAPFYLGLAGLGLDLRFLRGLRLVRVFRLFKMARYTRAAQTLSTALSQRKEKLIIVLLVNVILLLVASSAMYYVEVALGSSAFSSIPEAMWWGLATLARLPGSAGYAGATPQTVGGQLVGAAVAVLGIGIFALPASILAGGFMEVTERGGDAEERCPNCGESL